MTDPEHRASLPKVEEHDLLQLVIAEISDPAYITWWEQFADENPILAQEVRKRAYFAGINLDRWDEPPSAREVQKTIIDAVSFAMSALRAAAQRYREQNSQPLSAIDPESEIDEQPSCGGDADDADPQPSA